ncbi:MAG TPA: ATP-dependent metallopeptidase FtsH/Yme1/Tma family protein, partial [Gaiellaceae bacterium]|nr:ATP-dependent metallopeptidase FtsH/Yme1/Tma family protein [Gaiellaceae bacterium]
MPNRFPFAARDGDSSTGPAGLRARRLRFWVVVILPLLVVNFWLAHEATKPPPRIRVPYSPFFVDQVRAGNVAEISARGSTIQGTFRKPRAYEGSRTASRFRTEIPVFTDGAALTRLLQRERVVVNAVSLQTGPVWWKSLLFGFGPTIVLVGLLVWLLRRMRGGGIGGFGRSRARRYEASQSPTTFADVAGIDEAKAELDEIVGF